LGRFQVLRLCVCDAGWCLRDSIFLKQENGEESGDIDVQTRFKTQKDVEILEERNFITMKAELYVCLGSREPNIFPTTLH
jgi:hypothetical protein